ncbi:MAG: hypothetical protein KDH84_04155 [Calditrichaeota bacterium]|nr:hypothetical protein [Calditrichota bacterium]
MRFLHIGFRLAAVLLILVLMSCASQKLCCSDYQPDTDAALYCNDHRDVVVKFVKSTTDIDERKRRLETFKRFYDTVKLCRTLSCLESWIYDDETMPGFSQRYALDHEAAEQLTHILREDDKRKLIMCGFKNAIESLEIGFKGEVIK